MEGPPSLVRGRGLKINGSSHRPPSRNKQWVASGQEGINANGNDTDRWQRGGGPRRATAGGRGRARGLAHVFARSTPQLSVPLLHDEAASGTEDEGMTEVEDVEGEPEVEEKEPETSEERERFYQEVRNSLLAVEGTTNVPLVG